MSSESNVYFLHVTNLDKPIAFYRLDASKISYEEAKIKAELEYEKYRKRTKDELSKVEQDFLRSIKKTQKMREEKG